MLEFFVTFGSQYPHGEIHPTFPEAHCDGWLTVEATSYRNAREAAFKKLGPKWSMIYPAAEFEQDKHMYSKGELGRIQGK